MTSAESTQTSRLQVNFDDYVNVGDTDCDNGLAGKRLNCEYSGPPKSAREDPEILEILQQICPHLVVEVREDALKKIGQCTNTLTTVIFQPFFPG